MAKGTVASDVKDQEKGALILSLFEAQLPEGWRVLVTKKLIRVDKGREKA